MRHDPSLRLVASPDVLALIPAGNIIDTNGRPEVVPAILLGEGQTVLRRFNSTSYATIHVWIDEPGLVQAKQLGSAIVGALTFDAEVERSVFAPGRLRLPRPCGHQPSIYAQIRTRITRTALSTVAGVMKERP